ncbi:hypothetical protein GCM10022211_27030 [Sphingomonas humi]|uniref:CsbD family protein n=1 Tax=Sphingomonas humi TaxID=335630 RepID=A0ABP7SF53_9SPHN
MAGAATAPIDAAARRSASDRMGDFLGLNPENAGGVRKVNGWGGAKDAFAKRRAQGSGCESNRELARRAAKPAGRQVLGEAVRPRRAT